jgi:S1-C subfamily serine protease
MTPPQIYEKLRPAIVEVVGVRDIDSASPKEWHGTGWVYKTASGKFEVVTAEHVIDDSDALYSVIDSHGVWYVPTGEYKYHCERDGDGIGVLTLDGWSGPSLKCSTEGTPRIGSPIYSLGFAHAFTDPLFSEGYIAGGKYQNYTMTFFDIDSGDSGSPVVNSKCEVIGVVDMVWEWQRLTALIPIKGILP